MMEEYISPYMSVYMVEINRPIADSPLPGGNENVNTEDWSNLE